MSTSHSTAHGSHKDRPYRLGIAFSGGGARGLAHSGALMAIEEAGLKPDIVAGVSAGSVIAVLYAAGMRPIDMATMFARSNFRKLTELSYGGGGIFKIERFGRFILDALDSLGGMRRIEDLHIPTYIGVTDLDNARSVAFCEGEILPRMLASCSIPVIFPPININGVNYVDGGVLRNLPAWVLRDKCDTLIGINVSPILPKKEHKTLVQVAYRSYHMMLKANQVDDMAMCDVAVQTDDLTDYQVFDLRHIKQMVVSGYIHTRRALEKAGMWNHSTTDKSSK